MNKILSFISILLWVCCLVDVQAANAEKEKPPAVVRFVDVTEGSGINFIHSFGDNDFSSLIEAVGAGAAWLDYNRDGWLDLYIVTGKYYKGLSHGKRPKEDFLNRLYLNLGNGRFRDVTRKAGIGCPKCFSIGVTVGDYDNDGWPDIYVANYGNNVLYHNQGDGTFKDVTRRARVGSPMSSVAAAWFDFDRDGWLDLYVGNYIDYASHYKHFYLPDGFPGPLAYGAQPDVFYRNLGNGAFEDISHRAGIIKKGRAMSVSAADYNNDGYDDIYVTNDATENFLYKNIQGRLFQEVAVSAKVAFNSMDDGTASMAVDFGDYNNDGKVDIFVSDSSFSSLYRNKGDRFVDEASRSGIARTSAQFVGWGAFFFDYDNDGDLDIFKVNSDLSRMFGQEDQLYENMGEGLFQDVSIKMGPYFQEERMGRGAAFADYDNDGDLDIVIINIASKAVLLRNDGGNRNNSLTVRLMGRTSNRDGIGAVIKVFTDERTQIAQRRSAGGYLSQNDPRLLFGLGPQTTVKRIQVLWPSGKTRILENVYTGKTITIKEQTK